MRKRKTRCEEFYPGKREGVFVKFANGNLYIGGWYDSFCGLEPVEISPKDFKGMFPEFVESLK